MNDAVLEERNRLVREEAERATRRNLGWLAISPSGEVLVHRAQGEPHTVLCYIVDGERFRDFRTGEFLLVNPADNKPQANLALLDGWRHDLPLIRLWASARHHFPYAEVSAERTWHEEHGAVSVEFSLQTRSTSHRRLLRKRWGLEPYMGTFCSLAMRLREEGVHAATDLIGEGPDPTFYLTVSIRRREQIELVGGIVGEIFPRFWS